MTLKDKEILNYILLHPNSSTCCLCEFFQITSKKLLDSLLRIRRAGYYVNRIYHNNGEISVRLSNCMEKTMISTAKDDKKFHFAAIADTHIGHEKASIHYLNELYQYCSEQNIHFIFHLGDVVEGVENSNGTKFKSAEHQFSYLLKNYPYDSKILNFILFGNHDNWSSKTTKFNPQLFLQDKRLDMIPMGINLGYLHVSKELIAFCHDTGVAGSSKAKLILKGHSHKYRLINNENGCIIYIPTLSRIYPMSVHRDFIPSFLDIQIDLCANQFSAISVKQLQLQKEVTPVSECKVNFLKKS